MKKYTLYFSIVAGILVFSSCKRIHDCTCTITSNSGSSASSTTSTVSSSSRMNPREAKAWCESNEGSYSAGGYGYTSTCDLD